jgi:hypothetical protein
MELPGHGALVFTRAYGTRYEGDSVGLFNKKTHLETLLLLISGSTTPPLLATQKTGNKGYFYLNATAFGICRFFVVWNR